MNLLRYLQAPLGTCCHPTSSHPQVPVRGPPPTCATVLPRTLLQSVEEVTLTQFHPKRVAANVNSIAVQAPNGAFRTLTTSAGAESVSQRKYTMWVAIADPTSNSSLAVTVILFVCFVFIRKDLQPLFYTAKTLVSTGRCWYRNKTRLTVDQVIFR